MVDLEEVSDRCTKLLCGKLLAPAISETCECHAQLTRRSHYEECEVGSEYIKCFKRV